jgi:hypothetical protein
MINLNFEFMQQKTFPKFEAHNSVSCFHCDATIGQTENPCFMVFQMVLMACGAKLAIGAPTTTQPINQSNLTKKAIP